MSRAVAGDAASATIVMAPSVETRKVSPAADGPLMSDHRAGDEHLPLAEGDRQALPLRLPVEVELRSSDDHLERAGLQAPVARGPRNDRDPHPTLSDDHARRFVDPADQRPRSGHEHQLGPVGEP